MSWTLGRAAAIITAGATVLLSVFSLIFSKRWERSRELEQEHRRQKLPIYEQFMGFWIRFLLHENLGQPQPSDQETAQFLAEFTQKLILWGSDGVLREYSSFRIRAALRDPEGAESHEVMFDLERLLFEIRRDLGHANKKLTRGDLLALFVNDIQDYLEPQTAKAESGS